MAYENQLHITGKFLTIFPRKLSKRLVKYKIFAPLSFIYPVLQTKVCSRKSLFFCQKQHKKLWAPMIER